MQTPSGSLSSEIRWNDLRVFLALYRRRSLKSAAAELGVNLSTVSRRIDALEALLGLHLFDRTPDGSHPSLAAEQLVPHAETMEQAAMAFSRGVEGFEAEPEGEVRITAPPGIVDHFLAPAIAELCERHPRLRLSVLSTVAYADLTRREADIALRLLRPSSGDFVARRVATHGWLVVAAPSLVEALGRLRDPNATRWVTWGDDLASLSDARWLATHVDPGHVVLRTSSMTAQIEAVRTGLAAMLAPAPYAELPALTELPCTPKLRRSLAELPEASLWLVGHRALRDVPRIAAVWSWLEQRFLIPRTARSVPS